MESLFKLKNPNDNIYLLAFQYHTLQYSISVLKNRKMELRKDATLKNKIDNYLLMERLSIEQELHSEDLPFDIKANIKEYVNNPRNKDLKNYINICKHIVAKQLDMAEICSKVDLNDHLFVVKGKDLFCVDCDLSTDSISYGEIEKDFLYSCAKRSRRIVRGNSDSSNDVKSIYNSRDIEINNFAQVA